jgi:hypothetical protein
MDAEKNQKLECRNTVLLKYAVHWFGGCYEMALLFVSRCWYYQSESLTSESTLCSFLVRDKKRAVIA